MSACIVVLKYIAGVLLAGIVMNTLAIVRSRGADVSTSTKCLPASIRTALAKADAECGIKIISTWRKDAVIAGTNHPSMHAQCRAVDFSSRDYQCVYRVLKDWPGKMSMDATRIRPNHVHLDNGPRARFTHGSSARRLASR